MLGRRELNLVAICCAAIATQYHIKDCNLGNSTTDNHEILLGRKPLGYLPSFLLRLAPIPTPTWPPHTSTLHLSPALALAVWMWET